MALLLALLVLLGFGAATAVTSSSDDSPPPPPALELVSDAGVQRATQGSYCVTGAGVGECVDYATPRGPARASVVRPGEVVAIAFGGAVAVDGRASVRRLGCDEEILSLRLSPETRWKVRLEPGAYEVAAEAVAFETGRATGDTSGVLGLVVDAKAPLAIGPAPSPPACPA
jgi:hypothetical protein